MKQNEPKTEDLIKFPVFYNKPALEIADSECTPLFYVHQSELDVDVDEFGEYLADTLNQSAEVVRLREENEKYAEVLCKEIESRGLARCEFDDECDYCKQPELGSYAKMIYGETTETDYYICGKCAMSAKHPLSQYNDDLWNRCTELESELFQLRAANEWRYINEAGEPEKQGEYLCTEASGAISVNFFVPKSGKWYINKEENLWVIAYRNLPEGAEVK